MDQATLAQLVAKLQGPGGPQATGQAIAQAQQQPLFGQAPGPIDMNGPMQQAQSPMSGMNDALSKVNYKQLFGLGGQPSMPDTSSMVGGTLY